jgi:2-polyprenyl-6-methoxyphenol hydroxylase-like FAD-dependent oxidoreductase
MKVRLKMKSEPVSIPAQSHNGKKFGKAIVMGASIAGLWTARALIDHFDEVWVLERDHLPEGAEFRSGAPQVRQYHTLLESGLRQMKEWFPGLDEELISAGAVPYDVTGDIHLRASNFWYPRFLSGSVLLSCSRLLLEASLRRRLRQNPCIRFAEGVEVIGLHTDEEKRRVTGVRIRNRRGGSAGQEADPVYEAELVVDALGRRSRTPEWLVEMGYSAPKESEVDSFLGYVTRKYKRKPNTPMILILATPPNDPYGGLVFPEENDTMVAFIAGCNKHYPPTDPEEFDAFFHVLGPEFEEALRGAEPISQPSGYRGTSSHWHHYEGLQRWPERFVVLGDAFCGFNPIYGQGMSVAAMSAVALADRLQHCHGNLDGVAKPTLRKIGKITEGVWLLATSADLQWPGTQGGTVGHNPIDRFGRWYVGKMLEATLFDKQVRLEFLAVNQLVKPATALFAPGVFIRVMKHMLLKKRRRVENSF